jgi:hypothetical protein
MKFAVLALGPFGIVKLVNGAEVAGNAPNPTDWRLFDAADNDALAVQRKLNRTEKLISPLPKVNLAVDEGGNLFAAQGRIGADLYPVY